MTTRRDRTRAAPRIEYVDDDGLEHDGCRRIHDDLRFDVERFEQRDGKQRRHHDHDRRPRRLGRSRGNAGAGGMGMGGRAGAVGAGGSGGGNLVDGVACVKNSFGECFKDSWIMIACYSQAAQDCITNRPGTACPNQDRSLPMEQQGLTTDEYFTLGGAPGTMYRVTLRVNGVSEGKYYEMGTRAAGNGSPNVNDPNGIDGWYAGGRPVDFENYNIYRLTVRGAPTNPRCQSRAPKSRTTI